MSRSSDLKSYPFTSAFFVHFCEIVSALAFAHWSPIAGASHSKDYSIWNYGEYATPAVKSICEYAHTQQLETEMRKNSKFVRTVIKTRGISWHKRTKLLQKKLVNFFPYLSLRFHYYH